MVTLYTWRVLISPCWTNFIINTARTRITWNLNPKWTCPLVSIILPVLCSMMPKVNIPCRFIYCTWTGFIQQSFVISDGFKSFQVRILWKWFRFRFLGEESWYIQSRRNESAANIQIQIFTDALQRRFFNGKRVYCTFVLFKRF